MPNDGPTTVRPLSQVLLGLADDGGLSLGELSRAFGSRAHGSALLLLGLPEALPLPVPSVSAVLGIPLVVISAHLALYGEESRLPRRLRDWRLQPTVTRALGRHLAPWLLRAERLSRPRWQWLAGREHLLGWVCLYLSVLLLLPLPLFNAPPALCLVLLAWGMVSRDGVFVAAGLAGAVAVTAALAYLALWTRSLLD